MAHAFISAKSIIDYLINKNTTISREDNRILIDIFK